MTIEADQEDDGYCSACNGSGEGMYDGSTCPACKGCGQPIDEREQDQIAQGWAERRYEERHYGY